MKKIILGLVLSTVATTASAADFSFDKNYNLKMPANAERIGALVELKDYFELNPKISNITTEINNLSFRYNGFGKGNVKSQICLRVGKLELLSERIKVSKKRVLSERVPRLLNAEQSKVSKHLNSIQRDLNEKLDEFSSFCEGDLKLNEEEIRAMASDLSKNLRETAYHIHTELDSNNMLVPQNSDLFIKYSGAKHAQENLEGSAEKKDCSFKDIF